MDHSSDGMAERSRDPGHSLNEFVDDAIVVRCPACGARALVTPLDTRFVAWQNTADRRLDCSACTRSQKWPEDQLAATPGRRTTIVGFPTRLVGEPCDPFFGCDLWLQGPCRGVTIGFLSHRHLDAVEEYIAAGLRVRAADITRPGWDHGRAGGTTMLERLPGWMKQAKHRDAILAAIRKIRRADVMQP